MTCRIQGTILVTLGTVYNHWVIQVNRLSLVLAHRDKFWAVNCNASYRLENSIAPMPYIAFNARHRQHSVLVTDNLAMFWRIV